MCASPRISSSCQLPSYSASAAAEVPISGSGFSSRHQLNEVSFGGASCDIVSCNVTSITCVVALDQGTAGTYQPVVRVFNKGFAQVRQGVSHTILMTIDSLLPQNGSVYGGQTLTLTGSGFARFGLHNQIRLALLHNDSLDAQPLGTHDSYDDDWLWQRGHVGGNVSSTTPRVSVSDLLCVPRTLKNRACRYTAEDSGYPCGPDSGGSWLVSAHESIQVRERAE